MNLQPRKVRVVDWKDSARRYMPGEPLPISECAIPGFPGGEPLAQSIWRMELPNTSYQAPVAAFWWVSNERKA